jgi:hypothetical protein
MMTLTRPETSYEGRLRINARRVRAGWATFLAEFSWEDMLTLTTNPKIVRGMTEKRMRHDVERFCYDLAYLSRREVGWAFAVEGGGGPSLHAHVLVMGATTKARQAAFAGWQARSGFTQRTPVDSSIRAAVYLCKSIGRNGEIVFSDRLRSR